MSIVLMLLIAAYAQAESPTAAESFESIAESTKTAWTILENGVRDKSSEKRAKATHALGLLPRNSRAQEWAEKAIMDSNLDVRAQGAIALGDMGASSSQQKLIAALKDQQLKVVLAAANSLYKFKNPAAFDIYYALLTGERKGPGLLQSQLNTLKDKRQLEQLMFETGIGFVPFGGMGYEAFKTITHDDNSPLRAAAADKLATDPDAKTKLALERACSDNKWRVRLAVVGAIARRGDPSLLSSVSPMLYDGSDDVRYAAAATVIHLSSKSRSVPRSAAPKTK